MLSLFRMKNKLVFNSNKCFGNYLNLKPKECGIGRSFMKKVFERNEQNLSLNERPNIKSLLKPFIFTVGFSGTVYTVSIVWNFENTLVFRQKLNVWNDWKQGFHSIQDNHMNPKAGSVRNELNQWWNSRNDAFKLFVAIAAINVLVFTGWKIPRLQPFMIKHFMTHINTNSNQLKCLPMIWSTFSHYSLTHLGFNLMVLYSFSQIGAQLFGTEQFLALYLSSGVISSFASYSAKVAMARTGSSLGASGAILGILASCCVARPDLELVIIFLPFFTLSAGLALKGIIMMDTAGLLFGWRIFDHAAHLGGGLFGIWYTTWGQNMVSNHKREVIKIWQKIRNKIF